MKKIKSYLSSFFVSTRVSFRFFVLISGVLAIAILFSFALLNSRISNSNYEKARLMENSVTLAFDKLDNVLNSCDEMIKENSEIINREFVYLNSIDVGRLVDELRALKLQCPFIQEIVMYKPNDPDTITSQGTITKDNLFNLQESGESTKEFWEYAMLEYVTPFVLSLRSEDNIEMSYGFISSNKSFFVVPQIHPVYNIGFLIFVDEGSLLSHLSFPDSGSTTNVYLYNEDGDVIFSNNPKEKKKFDISKIEGKSYYTSGGYIRKFEYVKWFKYNNLILKIKLDNNIAQLYIISILLLLLLLAILLVMNFKKYGIYKSGVEKILLSCGKGASYDNIISLPEYISEGLNIKENYDIKKSVMALVLSNKSYYKSNYDYVSRVLGDFISNGKFRIYRLIFNNLKTDESFVSDKELEEKFGKERAIVISNCENSRIIIESFENFSSDIVVSANAIINEYSKWCDIYFISGQTFTEFGEINDEFEHLMADCQYISPLCKNTVVASTDIKKDYVFSDIESIKSELIQCLSAGNPYGLKKYISAKADSIIAENIPFNRYYYVVCSMYNCFLTVVGKFDVDKNTVNKYSEIFYKEMNTHRELLDFYSAKKSLLEVVSMIAYEINFHSAGDLNKKIIAYINQNFNKDMGLEELATHLNLSTKYLSYYFKKEFKIGFLKYLTTKRIEKAKELLGNTDENISDISRLVGYSSNVTFAGIFKKYTGMTPSLYRQSFRNK